MTYWARRASRSLAALLSLLPLLGGGWARADDPATFYAGKTITFVSGSSPGASYDLGSRLIARHLGRHIPGKPAVVVQNMPGAGSMAAANHLFNVAARDGSVIGMFGRGLYLEALFGAQGVRFDPLKFNWIGSHAKETSVLLSGINTPFKTIADVKAREMVIGSAPPGSDAYSFAVTLRALVGARLKIVAGYPGMAEALLAIDRGEVHGNPAASVGTLMGQRPQWLTEPGQVNFLLQLGLEPHPTFFKGTPLALDHALSPLDRQALVLSLTRLSIAYPLTAPPEVPPERVAALRAAFDAAVKDPEFLAEARRSNVDVSPLPGSEMLRIIAAAYASPAAVIAHAKAASAAGDK